MQKKSQVWLMAAAVLGVVLMGFAGWWIGGLGAEKAPAVVPVAEVKPEVAPATATPIDAAAADAMPVDVMPLVNGNLVLHDGPPGTFTLQTNDAGQIVITGVNGPQGGQGFRTGIVRTTTAPAAVGGPVRTVVTTNLAGPTVMLRSGTVSGGGITNVNGTVTTVTVQQNGDGKTATFSGTGTVVINGQTITVRPREQGQMQVEAGAAQPAPAPVNPNLP